jgi:hypothetical protein
VGAAPPLVCRARSRVITASAYESLQAAAATRSDA